MDWLKTHCTIAIRSTLRVCEGEREREREVEMSAFSLQQSPLDCMTGFVWCVCVFKGSIYPTSCLQLGVNSTTKISCLVACYHTTNLCVCVCVSRCVSVGVGVCVCAFKCFHEVLTVSPSSPRSSIVTERILLPFPYFTHLLPLSFRSRSTVLITHTPRSGPFFWAFEVILAQILLSYTADKTRKGLHLRACGQVCMCVCVCVSLCWLNHQCLLFQTCLYLSDYLYQSRVSFCVSKYVGWIRGEIGSIHSLFWDCICTSLCLPMVYVCACMSVYVCVCV